MLELIRQTIGDTELTITEQVQSLWSDYGAIVRCFSPKLNESIIVKFISPPTEDKREHPRGWNTSISHERKLTSYKMELAFYQKLANKVSIECFVPQLIAFAETSKSTVLVMQDLNPLGFSKRASENDIVSIKQGIKWLAHFHASFMTEKVDFLWPQGGYWHLSTRLDEWNNMPDSDLKTFADAIDQSLKSSQFKTVLHGDAKLANMCFHAQNEQVAAVDFQYVGQGPGVIDLAYFVGSALEQDELYFYHQILLDFYLEQLIQSLQKQQWQGDVSSLEKEYRQLYAYAWADFYRFLVGWNPKSWKVNQYIKDVSQQVLKDIKENNEVNP